MISANADAMGVAAALVLRVAGGGAQSFEGVARYDQGQGKFVPIPIGLGPPSDQVYVLLFGVGIRNAPNTDGNPGNGSAENVMVTVGGMNVPVLYAGSQGGFIGLDQINIGPMPRSLIGRGVVNVVVTVNGIITNTTQLWFK